ncbi:MAG: hypothetical protein DMF61_06210 [Blastocatellia bacterium AA13]|nr:MAG: hypothetical protein DMF61_06210 [Blastocatellia bacterium AA13]
MYCPNCAAEDQTQSQYCRACGIELNTVRTALRRPDSITASAISARDEIGRAIAARIRDLESADDLKQVVEDVLPQVEKFLESPEQRRLRTAREGTITAAVGLGATIVLLIVCYAERYSGDEIKFLLGAGGALITFLIGVAILINARWNTVVESAARSTPATLSSIPEIPETDALEGERRTPQIAGSVTEGTTRQLK